MPETPNEEYRMMNVQLATDLKESLNILKKRYKARSMAEALREFIREHDAEVLKAGQRIAKIQVSAAESAEEEEK